jgi:hypothetical protein
MRGGRRTKELIVMRTKTGRRERAREEDDVGCALALTRDGSCIRATHSKLLILMVLIVNLSRNKDLLYSYFRIISCYCVPAVQKVKI